MEINLSNRYENLFGTILQTLHTLFSSATIADRRNSISSSNEVKFLDKEHEREIVEREKIKSRPEIIHPLDLQSGGVEVVKITPKSQSQALFEKNKQANNKQTKSILVNKQFSFLAWWSSQDQLKLLCHIILN